jgi:hypothetical protein
MCVCVINKFCKYESHHCHYAILVYNSHELSSVNILHEHKLCNGSRTSEQSFVLVYRVYPVSMLFCHEAYYTLYKGSSLTVCACYLWEME